jgi:hypothetical protein
MVKTRKEKTMADKEKEATGAEVADEEKAPDGAFISSLKRNNKQIRSDRAEAISEDAQLLYKRAVEDLQVKIKRMERDQENMLDMSPDSAMSLKLASDFDAVSYVEKDVSLGVKIRNAKIKLEIAKKRYTYLFGETV